MQILKIIFQHEIRDKSYLKEDAEIYDYLTKKGKSREEILSTIEHKTKLKYFDIHNHHLDRELYETYDYYTLAAKNIIPVEQNQNQINFVASDLQDSILYDVVNSNNKKLVIKYFLMEFELKKVLENFQNHTNYFDSEPAAEEIVIDTKNLDVVKAVEDIIKQGLESRASDIHIEPMEKGIRIRYRIDGMMSLTLKMDISEEDKGAIINRFKIMSSMDIGEKRKSQDGRISNTHFSKDRVFDFRVSTVSTVNGEKIVLRVLERNHKISNLEKLGFNKDVSSSLRKALTKKNGLLFVTGATGSGKSTTLHAMISELDSEKQNIYTIEDPVELTIPNINQIDVKETGVPFDEHLISLLRQDPDVIVVGEIRDSKTAKLAIQAALTGHLVLSTLHTNGAVETFERLLHMDIEGYQLSACLIGIESQRLVRKLCPHCKIKSPLSEGEKNWLDSIELLYPGSYNGLFNNLREGTYHQKGCKECFQLGFFGRTVVAEYIEIDDEVNEMIVKEEINGKVLINKGFVPMFINSLYKVVQGETTIQEILIS
jgi:type II secretory ATPase GspE/PulE/Tfp pilus assembly ATPase PilB-like protein